MGGQVFVSDMPEFCVSFQCTDDCLSCQKACCFPALAAGEIAEAVESTNSSSGCGMCCAHGALSWVGSGFGLPCQTHCLEWGFPALALFPICTWAGDLLHGCTTSQLLRQQHGITTGNPCTQACQHIWCSTCAKTQELKLIKLVNEARRPAITALNLAPARQMMVAAPMIVSAPANGCCENHQQ